MYVKDRAFKEYGRGTFPVPRRGCVRFPSRFERTWARRIGGPHTGQPVQEPPPILDRRSDSWTLAWSWRPTRPFRTDLTMLATRLFRLLRHVVRQPGQRCREYLPRVAPSLGSRDTTEGNGTGFRSVTPPNGARTVHARCISWSRG